MVWNNKGLKRDVVALFNGVCEKVFRVTHEKCESH